MSELEEVFAFQARVTGLDRGMVRQLRFHPRRKWPFDFAWPERMVAVEVEGGTWTGGRHTRGGGFEKDCEKYNEAAIMGWMVLRATGKHVQSGQALRWAERAIESRTPQDARKGTKV